MRPLVLTASGILSATFWAGFASVLLFILKHVSV
jgi:hypothetical protein